MTRILTAVLLLCGICRTAADLDNNKVQSINIESALSPDFYVAVDISSMSGLHDAHPVHGCMTADSGYVMVGKALASEGSSRKRAFALKFSSDGQLLWVWSSAATGEDAASNAVLQITAEGRDDLVVAGYRVVGGKAQRSLTKLSVSTGSEIWTTSWPSGAEHGAFEMISLTADKHAVLLAGLTDAPSRSEFNFKSYGNVVSGTALVQKLPVRALLAAVAPGESAVTWTFKSSSFLTSKAARSLPDGSVVALLYGEEPGQMASLVKLSQAGSIDWGPNDFGAQHGEGTDVAVASDGSGFAIVGHGDGGVPGALSGRLTKVSRAGVWAWTQSYSAGGNPKLIKNECWGLQALNDGGFVLGCGTGIEDCSGISGAIRAKCKSGLGDERPGAMPRKESIWQSLIVRTDRSGRLLWQRVDQHRAAGDPPMGAKGWRAQSSASEYVLASADGRLMVSINDEESGVGLLRLSVDGCGKGLPCAGAAPPMRASAAIADQQGEEWEEGEEDEGESDAESDDEEGDSDDESDEESDNEGDLDDDSLAVGLAVAGAAAATLGVGGYCAWRRCRMPSHVRMLREISLPNT